MFAVKRGAGLLYPAFQFDTHIEPRDGVAEVLAVLPDGLTGWALAF